MRATSLKRPPIRLLPFLPVREPLIGEMRSPPHSATVPTVPGSPTLHPGVDLVQDYGSEFRDRGGTGDSCGTDGRLWRHGRDRPWQRSEHPLRPPVRNPGRGRPGGEAGRSSAVSARPAVRLAPICTTRFGSTASRSIPSVSSRPARRCSRRRSSAERVRAPIVNTVRRQARRRFAGVSLRKRAGYVA